MADVKTIKPDLGMNDEQVEGVVAVMKRLLADEFLLYTKLRNYHWNVTGPQFVQLHELFENQYDELADVVDNVAERIRQYGAFAPGTMKEFLALTRLEEEAETSYPSARDMVARAVADHEALVRFLREDIETVDDLDDEGAEDMLIGLMQNHQKMAWFLRAFIEGSGV